MVWKAGTSMASCKYAGADKRPVPAMRRNTGNPVPVHRVPSPADVDHAECLPVIPAICPVDLI
jgi:hypothetical protein